MTYDAGARIVALARQWVDTPYQHAASIKGVGCDCLGLVRGVWREIYGAEPCAIPAYSPDWAERADGNGLLSRLSCHMLPVARDNAAPGDVLAFRMAPGAAVKHLAIKTGPHTLVHAYWGRAVTESAFIPYWNRRLAAVFRFPEMPHG